MYFGDIREWIFSERDLLVFFIPPRQFWLEEVKSLTFPLWNPYYYNGHPLFATLQAGVLYPFSFLYLLLPFHWAFNLNIEIHYALSGWFTYLLLRGMKASQGAALIAGTGFMLSGYLLSVMSMMSTLFSVIWAPLFLLVYFAAILKNNSGYALLAGIVGTLMFLGGGVEVNYLIFAVAFLLTLIPKLIFEEELPRLKRRLLLFGLFCLTFLGLSAFQLIPFMELSQLSIRSSGISYKNAATWSLHLGDLIEFLLPDQYGLATDIKKYWTYQNWIKTIYMGGIPFLLALFFLKTFNRQALGYLFLFVFSLSLALGSNTLFHHFLYDHLPFFNKVRYPVKFIFLTVLVLCIAAGLGYDCLKKELAEDSKTSRRWAGIFLFSGFCCVIIFGALDFYNEEATRFAREIGWVPPKYNSIDINLFNIKRFLAIITLFCLSVFLYSIPQFRNKFILGFMISLLTLDLFFAHVNFYHREKINEVNKMGENAKFILSDKSIFRTHITHDTIYKKHGKIKKEKKNMDLRKENFLTGQLGNLPIFFSRGIGVMEQKRWYDISELIKTAPTIDSTNLLNMMNVKYVVSIPQISSENFKLVKATMPLPKHPEEMAEFEKSTVIKIYENKKVLPRAFLVPGCRIASTQEDYRDIFQDKLFDPKSKVLLDKAPQGIDCNTRNFVGNPGSVEIESYKSNTVDILVDSKIRQFLFLSDSFYPGWKAYVDEEETKILRANYLFRAVVIEPGKHRVRFEYDPLSFKLGSAITIATIFICGIFYFRKKFLKESPNALSASPPVL